MTLADLVRTDVVTAPTNTSASELARTMRDERVGCVVITDGATPVGIVTDRDLAVRVVADGADPDSLTASDVMTENPTTATMDMGLLELTELMEANEVRRMPVVDGTSLAGLITLDDVNRLLIDELDNLGDVIEAESPPY